MLHEPAHKKRRLKARRNASRTYLFDVLIGGGKTATLCNHRRRPPNLTLIIDVAEEANRTRELAPAGTEILCLTLGDGETGDTLFRGVYKEAQRVVGECGALLAKVGCGQARGIGARCAEILVETDSFKRFIEDFREKIRFDTQGATELIRGRLRASSAGGTGAGALTVLAIALVEGLKQMNVPIEIHLDLLDFVTFSGFGQNIVINTAATLAEVAELLLTKGGNPLDRVVRSVGIFSLPPFLHDKARRDAYIRIDTQCMECPEMLAFLRPIEPNDAILAGPLGNITIRQAEFLCVLDPYTEIAATIAQEYYNVLDSLLGQIQPQPEIIEAITPEWRNTPIHREPLERVISSAHQRPIEDSILAVLARGANLHCDATIHLVSGEEYVLGDLEKYFISPPESLTSAADNLTRLLSLQYEIAQSSAEVSTEVNELTNLVEKLKKNARRRIKKYLSRFSIRRRWALNKAIIAVTVLRDVNDRLLESKSLHFLFCEANRICQQLIAQHRKRLTDILLTLDSVRPKGDMRRTETLVAPRSMDDAFPDLLRIATASREIQIEILASQVDFVTKAGLARVTGAVNEDLSEIADLIASSPSDLPAPYLGGVSPKKTGKRVIVVPPLETYVSTELRKLLEARLPNEDRVISSDLASAGVAVVRYRFTHPQCIEELFPGSLMPALEESVKSDSKHLFFRDVTRTLAVLGLNLEGDQNDDCNNGNDDESADASPNK